jgi:gliding motility-associated-like protein
MLLRLLSLSLLFMLVFNPVSAQQNLVDNCSFENYQSCPNDVDDFSVVAWNTPTKGSPDYFNICGNSNVSVPNNIFGMEGAYLGNGYVGIYCYSGSDFREYIQTNLTETLIAGQTYSVSFYVSLAENVSDLAVKEIGAYFSSVAVHIDTNKPLSFLPQICFYDSVITNTKGWTNVKGSFKANGNEKYLIIGNFNSDQSTTTIPINNMTNTLSYYYVDEVSVFIDTANLQSFAMPTAFSPNGDGRNDTYYPVFFDSMHTVIEFRIYNRWGQLVYNNPSYGWNGYFNNELQPSDVYMYYVYADVPNPTNPSQRIPVEKQGTFTLLK